MFYKNYKAHKLKNKSKELSAYSTANAKPIYQPWP